jgi:beta-phosphoglucomutase-like phosphatase (HAD superfamily)
MKRTGIIFDVGGTLLLTDELHRAAWREALRALDLFTEDDVRRADEGLAQGLDSFAIATSMGIGPERGRRLALCKQRFAQVPRCSAPNAATVAWLDRQENALPAAISHSDVDWTRSMLQLAGLLDRFAFVRGRTDAQPVPKQTLVADAAVLLRNWWGADELVYCGDKELDREVARQLDLPFTDARAL